MTDFSLIYFLLQDMEEGRGNRSLPQVKQEEERESMRDVKEETGSRINSNFMEYTITLCNEVRDEMFLSVVSFPRLFFFRK